MALLLYMDVHVPAAITEGLRRRDVDVLTSQEDGTREADDEALLARAVDLDRMLFSEDRDLLRIAREWQLRGQSFPGLVFAHQSGLSIGQCIEDLELLVKCCDPDEMASRVIFLPLS